MSVQQDNPRYANPSASADYDASANSTKSNPLAQGKKDVNPGDPKEWGSLRMGVPKDDAAFGLPVQVNPTIVPEASQFAKGREYPGNATVAKSL